MKKLTFTILADEPGSGEEHVLCPVCEGDYVHLHNATVVIAGKDDYKAHPNVRGNVIVIPGWCEEGHHLFNLMLGFHKGYTYAWGEERTSKLPGDPPFEEAGK